MSEFVISSRYANALIQIAEEKNSFEKVVEDIIVVKETLAASKELRNVLESPIIPNSKKSAIISDIFNSNVGEIVVNYLQFINNKGRVGNLFDIANRFLELSDYKVGRVNIDISSAIELDETQKTNIVKKLEEITNKKVLPKFNVDPSIIGGFKARFKDTVIDATVQHQLELLKKKFFEQEFLNN